MHGTDDQIVPYADAAPLAVKLLKQGTLKSYDGLPHGNGSAGPRRIRRRPETSGPDLGRRFGLFFAGARSGIDALGGRVAIHQLDDRHRRIVAVAETRP